MGLTDSKRGRLEAKGWKVGTVAEFLELTPEEELVVEIRLRLASLLKERRQSLDLSQGSLARRIGSSQSRVARIEASDPSVSLDLLVKAVGATGGTLSDVADALGHPRSGRS